MPKATTPIAKTIFDGVFTELFMTDKNGRILNVGDDVLFEFREGGYPASIPPTFIPAKVADIRLKEIKVTFGVKRWRWVPGNQLEYATQEMMFLYQLEN